MSHALPRRTLLTGGAVFVVSDAVTFVALLGAALTLRVEGLEWPGGGPDRALLGMLTALLFGASALLGLSRRLPAALYGAALLGLAFVAGEGWEWRALVRAGVQPASDLRHASLFVVTGLHAVHVFAGSIYALSRRGREHTILALYWAALDLAWLGILFIVYR